MMLCESLCSLFKLKLLMGESTSIVRTENGTYTGLLHPFTINGPKWTEIDCCDELLHSPLIFFRTRQTAKDLPLVPAGNLSSKCCQAF